MSPDSDRSAADPGLDVVTWNLSYELLTPQRVLPWIARRDRIADVLRSFDIVALQELSGRQLSDLTERMPGFDVVNVRTPMPEGLHQALGRRLRVDLDEHELGELALLLRRERLKLQGHGASWLSPTPEVPLSTGWGNEIPRQWLWARVHDADTGVPWLVVTTHVDLAAVRPMIEHLQDILAERVLVDDAAVLLGDLNTMADPDAFSVLVAGGWRDSHISPDLTEDPTFLGDLAGRPGRIDHILVAGRAEACDWHRLPDLGGELSDHLAVAATIRVSGPA